MSLESWHEAGLITTHATSRQEISDLLAIVDVDLKDAEIPELSAERKLSCCYNAVLTAARKLDSKGPIFRSCQRHAADID